MKKLALSFLLVASSSAFAYVDGVSHSLHGEGTWTDTKGLTGEYEVSVHITKEGDGVVSVEENLLFGQETKQFTHRLVKTGSKFFDVMSGETKIGDGYCLYDEHRLHKICHYDYSVEGHAGEKTIRVNTLTGKVKRMGSCTDAGRKLVWSDKLKEN